MNYGLAINLYPEPLRSVSFSSLSGTYIGIGAAFAHPIRILHITNLTDVTVLLSLDGITDHLVTPSNSFILLDLTANKTLDQGSYIAQGSRIYVKEIGIPTTGDVYVAAWFGTTGTNG